MAISFLTHYFIEIIIGGMVWTGLMKVSKALA